MDNIYEQSQEHKQKCEELRKIRVEMAKQLRHPELVRKEPCNFKGVCTGTCPACYQEEIALMQLMYEKYKNDKAITIIDDSMFKDNESTEDDYTFGESEYHEEKPITRNYPHRETGVIVSPITPPVQPEDKPKTNVFNEFNGFGVPRNKNNTFGGMTVAESPRGGYTPPELKLPGKVVNQSIPIEEIEGKKKKKFFKKKKEEQ